MAEKCNEHETIIHFFTLIPAFAFVMLCRLEPAHWIAFEKYEASTQIAPSPGAEIASALNDVLILQK